MKVAVIGSGASAFGVVSKLLSLNKNIKIYIFDNSIVKNHKNNNFPEYQKKSKKKTFSQIRKNSTLTFPPQKTFYGITPIKAFNRFYDSKYYGGQTIFWGGTIYPFDKNEFIKWPIEYSDLTNYYDFISKLIPITSNQKDDQNNNIFANSNKIELTQSIKNLKKILHYNDENLSYSASEPCLAMNFNKNPHPNCEFPGECISDCNNHGVYKTIEYFNKIIDEKNVFYSNDDVLSIEYNKKIINLNNNSSCNFDKIYICAGAINSAKILMRSFDINEDIYLNDSALIQFPVFDLNKGYEKTDLFSHTNLLLSIREKKDNLLTQFQIHPSYKYLFDYYLSYLPINIDSLIPFNSLKRLIWFRGYSNNNEANKYKIYKTKRNLFDIEDIKINSTPDLIKLCNILRNNLKSDKFVTIKGLNIYNKTSAHYGCTFPFNKGYFNTPVNGEIVRDIFLCDASTFNTLPSTSPTFTIMANAARIAELSLNKF